MLPAPMVAEFRIVDVGEENVPNWTIEDARVRPRIYRQRYPERLRVVGGGFGTEAANKEVVFSLTGKIMQRKTVQVPASGVATVEFDSFDVPIGSNRGEVRISPADGLPPDHLFQFTLERREPHRLLFLREAGEERELYYIRSALGAEADSPWVLDARTPAEALSLPVNNYAAVILSNVGRLPDALVGMLRAVVQKGGGLLITAGN